MATLYKFHLFLKSRPAIKKLVSFGRTAFSPRYLLYTNLVISGPMSALGDVIQQTYQHSKPDNNAPWDRHRTLTMFVAGVSLTPFCHYYYVKLDKFLPGNSAKTALLKLLPGVALYSPCYVIAFLSVTSLMDKDDWETFKTKVKAKTIGLMTVDFLLWGPVQFLNFYFLPTRYRILCDSVVSLVADVFFSYVTFDYSPHNQINKDNFSHAHDSRDRDNFSHVDDSQGVPNT